MKNSDLLNLKIVFSSWIKKVPFIPVQFILGLDLLVVTINFVIAYLFLSGINSGIIGFQDAIIWSVVMIFVVAILMISKSSFKSFVRFTDIYEIINFGALFFFALLISSFLNYLVVFSSFITPIPFSFIVLSHFGAFIAVILYRLVIKEIYFRIFKYKQTAINTIIFGAGRQGIIVFQILNRETNPIRNVRAFFDDDSSMKGKVLFGKHILTDNSKFQDFIKKNRTQELIIASDSLSRDRKDFIFSICLNLKVEVKFAPSYNVLTTKEMGIDDLRNINLEDLLGREAISINQDHLSTNLFDKVVLVSGAAGSIGSEICRQLSKNNLSMLIILDIAESALFDINEELCRHSVSFPVIPVLADIRNRSSIEEIFEMYRPNYVFHAAAYKHVPLMESFPKLAIETNILGTKNLADKAELFGVEKFIFISTDKAVNPTNVMGASKRCAEIYMQAKFLGNASTSKTQFITTRFGNVLGSNGSVIPTFKKQIESGGPVTVTDQNIVRYFMTIPEACSLVLEAGSMGNGGEIFVFDMGKPVKIYDLAIQMIKLSGRIPYKDINIKISGLRSGEKLFEELVSSTEDYKETYHPKIQIVHSSPVEFLVIDSLLEELEAGILNGSNEDHLVGLLKVLIPEYKSKVSRFAILDN
jgi:FlaA1/EpsC-like NDP-sugar epimerase